MVQASTRFSLRRSIYWLLFGFAIIAPAVLTLASLTGPHNKPFEAVLLLVALLSTALLCIWCAVHVSYEPGLVRIAQIWIAALAFFLILVIYFALGNVG